MAIGVVTLGNVNIRYRDSGGDGPVVFMSGGIGSSLEFFDAQFDGLPDGLRLIAWDYPGHGLSDLGDQPYDTPKLARTALALLDALEVGKALLVGNSLGGTVSIHLRALAPERVTGMVLISPAMLGRQVFFPFRLMTLPGLGEAMNTPGQKSVEMQIAGIFAKGFTPPAGFAGIVSRNVMKPGASPAFLATLRAMTGLRGVKKAVLADNLARLRAGSGPVAFVHGREDGVLPFAQSQAAAALCPGARVEIVEGCGHTAQIEKPALVNELIAELIGQTHAG